MMKYYKVKLGNEKDVLWVSSNSFDSIRLWVLRNCSMDAFYGMSIVQVDPRTKESWSGADFCFECVPDYYHREFPGMSDEEIKEELISQVKNRLRISA